MQEITLSAEPRAQIGSSAVRRLRRAGRVPGVVYGLGDTSVPVTVDGHEIQRALAQGSNTLINLELGGDTQLTLAREVQRHPIKGQLLHIDFVRIRADQPVEASVQINLLGEPAGLKEGGVLEHVLFEVLISAKPREIPQSIDIDVSDLGVGEQKRVADLSVPPGVELLTDPERVVANVVIPRVEEEEGPTLSAEEMEELEGLSEEELDALQELAEARAPEEEGEEAPDEAAGEGDDGDESGGDTGEED